MPGAEVFDFRNFCRAWLWHPLRSDRTRKTGRVNGPKSAPLSTYLPAARMFKLFYPACYLPAYLILSLCRTSSNIYALKVFPSSTHLTDRGLWIKFQLNQEIFLILVLQVDILLSFPLYRREYWIWKKVDTGSRYRSLDPSPAPRPRRRVRPRSNWTGQGHTVSFSFLTGFFFSFSFWCSITPNPRQIWQ